MMTLGFALLSDTYPSNKLGAEMGKVLIGQTLGLMAGPPLGGLLQDHVGVKAPYVFCMVLIVIDLAARLLIIEPRAAKVKALRELQKKQQKHDIEKPEGSIQAPLKQETRKVSIIRALLTNKRLLTALVVSFIQAFLIAGTSLLRGPTLVDGLH